ncbi:hypothetical protein J4440_04435 [Candidatus Woesearchaeota archaeon]|nr:hypothetical protein [Candidatus Woesearchaeota archaeon]
MESLQQYKKELESKDNNIKKNAAFKLTKEYYETDWKKVKELLEDNDQIIREGTSSAIYELTAFDLSWPEELIPILISLLKKDKNENIRSNCAGALHGLDIMESKYKTSVVSGLKEAANDKSKIIKIMSFDSLNRIALDYTYVSKPIPKEIIKDLIAGLINGIKEIINYKDEPRVDSGISALINIAKQDKESVNIILNEFKKSKIENNKIKELVNKIKRI